MLSYNHKSSIQLKNIAEMDDSTYEFRAPDNVPSQSRPKPKRIIELNQFLSFSAQKKNYNCRNTISSATRFPNKKPTSLSQNMSTSKKLTIEKKRITNGIKRAIDFSSAMQKNQNFINNENCIIKNGISNKHALNKTVSEESSFRPPRLSYHPKFVQSKSTEQLFSPIKTPKSSQRMTPIKLLSKKGTQSSAKKRKDPETIKKTNQLQSPTRSTSTKRRSPLKAINIESNLNASSCSSSSDKENGDEVSNMMNFVSKKTLKLINSHQKVLEDYKSLKLPESPTIQNELQNITLKNFKVMSQIMRLFLELMENNIAVLNIACKSSSQEKAASKDKQSNENSMNEATVNQETADSVIDKPVDMRRIAFANLGKKCMIDNVLQEKSPDSKLKKSMIMYESMKSNMKFLKTPKGQGFDDKFETPNTKCRSITSNNVQKQLEKLFDS